MCRPSAQIVSLAIDLDTVSDWMNIKVDELANSLQVCVDSGAKKVLLPMTSAADLGTVPAELISSFNRNGFVRRSPF